MTGCNLMRLATTVAERQEPTIVHLFGFRLSCLFWALCSAVRPPAAWGLDKADRHHDVCQASIAMSFATTDMSAFTQSFVEADQSNMLALMKASAWAERYY